MSKLAALREMQREIELLEKRKQALEQDETLKNAIEFEQRLDELLDEMNLTKKEALAIIAPDHVSADGKSGSKLKGRTRPSKTFINPYTGEKVITKGSNHKTLNKWKDEYGKDTVVGWEVRS